MSLVIYIAGLIIGLGAVTVIDVHGLLGRKSHYWTAATTTAHKVTKPLIWIGTFLCLIGGSIFYKNLDQTFFIFGYSINILFLHLIIFSVMILNGLFLTFGVSRFLLKREKEGRKSELLPVSWQRKITVSFIISIIGWWGSVLILSYILTLLIK